MKWFLGFVATFTLGGMAGVMMSVPGIDFQVHNSLFLVAHFHTMVIGAHSLEFLPELPTGFQKLWASNSMNDWAIMHFGLAYWIFCIICSALYIGLHGCDSTPRSL
jgi:cytochrome o ubiquinol oxidase subunit 1